MTAIQRDRHGNCYQERATGVEAGRAAFGELIGLGMLNRRTNQFAKNFHPWERCKLEVSHCYSTIYCFKIVE